MIRHSVTNNSNSFLFRGFFFVLLSLFSCSEIKDDAAAIGEQDKSVFFLTSKGTYWWWLHKNEDEKNWKLYIVDVHNKRTVSSTVFSNSLKDFEFKWQQTGDKLWYISPEGKLEARVIYNGDISDSQATISRNFMNLKGDIEKVEDARPRIISGYILTTINGEQFHFNINEMLVSSLGTVDAALKFKTATRTFLFATDSCTREETCCISSLKWITKKVSALSGDYFLSGNDTAALKIETGTANSDYRNATVQQDELFAFVLWTKDKKLFLDCFEKKSQKLKWSVDSKMGNDCDRKKAYSISNLRGEVLLQTVDKKTVCKVFRLEDGSILTEITAEDLVNLNKSKD